MLGDEPVCSRAVEVNYVHELVVGGRIPEVLHPNSTVEAVFLLHDRLYHSDKDVVFSECAVDGTNGESKEWRFALVLP